MNAQAIATANGHLVATAAKGVAGYFARESKYQFAQGFNGAMSKLEAKLTGRKARLF